MNSRKTILLAVLCTALAACVSTKNRPLDSQAFTNSSPQRVVLVNRERPGFAAITAGKAAIGGFLGSAAMMSAGDRVVEENGVDDPAQKIGQRLAADLARTHQLEVVTSRHVTNSNGERVISRDYSVGDLALDVRTINWGFGYFPTDWNNYRVVYSAKLRLLDTRTADVLAEGFCSRTPEKSEDAPSHDELLADRAARLKAELDVAAEHCIGVFGSDVLGLTQGDTKALSTP